MVPGTPRKLKKRKNTVCDVQQIAFQKGKRKPTIKGLIIIKFTPLKLKKKV